MSENNNNDLNEVFEEEMDDADVITVPIDETLSNSGEAADAAAVGAALALKADKDELPATIKVNGQQADNQGLILINGTHIPVNGSTQKTLAEAVSEVSGMTAETIPMSEETGAATIAAEIEDIKEDVSDLQEAIDGMEEKTADNIPMETGSTTTVKNAIETLDRKAVKSVNRKLPDAAGDVDLSVVPLAENLQSDKLQSIEGEFIIRTTGGNGAVADGKAYPQHIYGNCQHNGYVAEVLNLTVIPITRTEPDEPITATIDRDTFVAAVDESSTINLYYTTEWSEDPEDYGVTVTGDPVAGDQITIVYVKEQRGTILVADPDRLVGTGWNLFNANDGYARVVKYSDVYGYKIGGTYTSIAFSATLTGDRTSLLPNANGLFNVPSDGYVFVTGGNATDTYILATWSDWTNGPSTGYWEAYRESGIDLSAVVETYFPYGMLKIGTVRDEIDLVAKRSISRIERMVYSEENRAAAAATGRAYDFDENNIYIVRAEYVQNAITISTEYSVSEHGLEWFTETDLPLDTEILYGKNLRDKLERDVLTISAQTLTEEEKEQARTNIGAMSQEDGDKKLVAPTAAGTAGQLLRLKADGGTEWNTQGTPTDAQVGTAVSAWLTAHPEATTTVQDGAISRAKLNDDLKEKTDAVTDLKSAINVTKENDCIFNTFLVDEIVTVGFRNTSNNISTANPDWRISTFKCAGGDIFTFYTSAYSNSIHTIVAFDENNNVVYGESVSDNITVWIAPMGAVKVDFSYPTNLGQSHYTKKKLFIDESVIYSEKEHEAEYHEYALVDPYSSETGYINNQETITVQSAWSVDLFNVEKYDKYKINMTSNASAVVGILIKDNNNVTTRRVQQNTFTDYEIEIRPGEEKMYISHSKNNANVVKKYKSIMPEVIGASKNGIKPYQYNENLKYLQIDAEQVSSGYINTSGNVVQNNDWCILQFSCTEGEKYRITARSASVVDTIFIVDENGNKVYEKTGTINDFEITIPEKGSVLKVSHGWTYGIPARVKKQMLDHDVCFSAACFGDSLTFGNQDHTGVNYPNELRNLIKNGKYIWSVERNGFGGDPSVEIATMQGGIPLYVKPFEIPATTTAVELAFICGDSSYTGTYVPADQNMGYLSEVMIAGVKGAITLSSGKYYFTRAEAGDAVSVTRPALVFTHGYDIRDNIQIIWVGTNDTFTASTADVVIDRINDMINFLDTKKYIVIGMTCKARFSDIEEINGVFSRKFGSHFLNVRDYILEYGLSDAQITPTAQDETDIANGEMPTSLRVDTVHFNQYGYKIIANLVYKKGIDLGYWE